MGRIFHISGKEFLDICRASGVKSVHNNWSVPLLGVQFSAEGSPHIQTFTKYSVMAPLLSFQAIALFVSTVLLLPHPSAQTTCATIAPRYAPVVAAGYTAKVLMN